MSVKLLVKIVGGVIAFLALLGFLSKVVLARMLANEINMVFKTKQRIEFTDLSETIRSMFHKDQLAEYLNQLNAEFPPQSSVSWWKVYSVLRYFPIQSP